MTRTHSHMLMDIKMRKKNEEKERFPVDGHGQLIFPVRKREKETER